MELTIRKPDDMHLHLRQGTGMRNYAADSASSFARAVIMPNITPPIISSRLIREYYRAINEVVPDFHPIMTFQLIPGIDKQKLRLMLESGAAAGKLFPAGVTTNSENGITDIDSLFNIFSIMEELDIILSIHGENPTSESLNRETDFLPVLTKISENFPKLRIILEHVSTKCGVLAIGSLPDNVAATITVHHLLLTLDDVIGDTLQPHNFCKPIPKTADDREALREAVFSGNKKFFFGSDSAPHLKADKEASRGAAGIYSAPVAVSLLAQLFDENNKLDMLENFTSRYGAEFYTLPLNRGKLTLSKKPWTIPAEYHGVVTLFAGKEVSWQITG